MRNQALSAPARPLLPVILLLGVLAAGCSSKDTAGNSPINPSSAPVGAGLTTFMQMVPAIEGYSGRYGEMYPGSANIWNLATDFSVSDRNNWVGFETAMQMMVGIESFPSDQTYQEVTFGAPVAAASSGLTAATVNNGSFISKGSSPTGIYPLSGSNSAYLGYLPDARLTQALDLSAAAGTITLSWNASTSPNASLTGDEAWFRVLLRSPNDASRLATLFDSQVGGPYSADITPFRGQKVVISFESRSDHYQGSDCYAVLDDVSVLDQNGMGNQFVSNGDFEAGNLTGWTAGPVSQPRTVSSGSRSAGGLSVTRSFYAPVGKLWARWADTFANNDTVALATTVEYYHYLGSDGYGVVYQTPATGGIADRTWDGAWALTTWDTSGGGGSNYSSSRDAGLVFGKADEVDFQSETEMNWGSGSGEVYVRYHITVPPGGRVTLVNFALISPYTTESWAWDTGDRATGVDWEAKEIVDGFWTDPQYRESMTTGQIESIANWPK